MPKYRGAAPVNWAIYHGETETGVSVIHMTPRLDAGPVVAQGRTPIEPDETAEELEKRLSEIDSRLTTTTGTRGLGLLQGLVLADEVDPVATLAALHAAGLLLTTAGGNVIRISPSLNVTREELDEGLAILEPVLADAPRKA